MEIDGGIMRFISIFSIVLVTVSLTIVMVQNSWLRKKWLDEFTLPALTIIVVMLFADILTYRIYKDEFAIGFSKERVVIYNPGIYLNISMDMYRFSSSQNKHCIYVDPVRTSEKKCVEVSLDKEKLAAATKQTGFLSKNLYAAEDNNQLIAVAYAFQNNPPDFLVFKK